MNKPGALLLLAVRLLAGCNHGTPDPLSCGTSRSAPLCSTAEACSGQCVPLPPLGWSLPLLLWVGPELEAPECPVDLAGVMQYEGHADPVNPAKCPVCSCELPTGECELPSFLVVSTPHCTFGPGTILYDFSGLDTDPTSCNTESPVPPGTGTRSLTIGPLTKTERECKPVATVPPRSGQTPWKTFARACSYGASACLDPNTLCIPTPESSPGFSQCIYQRGELECPSDYPKKSIFYDELRDSRNCSACWCGAPEGGECTAMVKAYQDAACTVVEVGRTMRLIELCSDIGQGTGLGSKTATTPIYEPGACKPSGGEPVGSAELLGPTTFCCQ